MWSNFFPSGDLISFPLCLAAASERWNLRTMTTMNDAYERLFLALCCTFLMIEWKTFHDGGDKPVRLLRYMEYSLHDFL
jgi:hypothetical protein